MYVDSSPVTAHRSPDTPRVRSAFRKATPRTAGAAARRTRLDDAIVSQWLLEQVPSEHRHSLRGASDPRGDLPAYRAGALAAAAR